MLKYFSNGNLQLTFKNGYTLSIGFGPPHYVTRFEEDRGKAVYYTGNVEVLIWDSKHEIVTEQFIKNAHPQAGWINLEDLAELMLAVSKHSDEDDEEFSARRGSLFG